MQALIGRRTLEDRRPELHRTSTTVFDHRIGPVTAVSWSAEYKR
jgi:hypothetical protein